MLIVQSIPSVPDSHCCRYAIQLLTPASILARLAGRDQIENEDIGEMNELFLDAKTSASLIAESGDYARQG
jgi:RuvB-like protein 1